MANIKELNEKLQQLLELTAEVNGMLDELPYNGFGKNWETVFGEVENLDYAFRAVSTDMCVDTLHDVEIMISGNGSVEDFATMEKQIFEEFPEFLPDGFYGGLFGPSPLDDRHRANYKGLWIGDPEDFIRLTHHAEALWENTNIENIHVEVCVDGEWYGKEHEDVER